MPVELTVPQLGESITEAVVGKWHKQAGDEVRADEPVVSLETDKVTVDVPAPSSGALSKVVAKEGETVKVGDVLGTISEGYGGVEVTPASPESAASREKAVKSERSERAETLPLSVPQLGESITEAVIGTVHKKVGDAVTADEPILSLETDKVAVDVGAPATGTLVRLDVKEGDTVTVGQGLGAVQATGEGASSGAPGEASEKSAAGSSGGGGDDERPAATPVAKRLAEERGIDLSAVQGSGAQGRVTKEDILSFNAREQPAAPKEQPAAGSSQPARETKGAQPAPSGAARPQRDEGALEERVRMTPLRRRVAQRLVEAQATAAILTTFNEVDLGEVMALRKTYGDRFQKKHDVKLGFMSFFVRAALEALREFPQLNAEIDGDEVVFKRYYHVGVAVSGSRGLVVPVLRDADRLSMAEIEKGIADLGTRARNDKLGLQDLQGGTFTISNGGIFGSMLSTPIINPPQTGILGMHNIQERAVVRDGQIVIRPMMYLALSYDHRLIDGREAVQFLVRIKDGIEEPSRLLLDV